MRPALELKRKARQDGHHEVTVALGAVDHATLLVPSEHVDGPGYQEMLDLALDRHLALSNMAEGRPAR